jgi:hypothetical protein
MIGGQDRAFGIIVIVSISIFAHLSLTPRFSGWTRSVEVFSRFNGFQVGPTVPSVIGG